MPRQRAPRKSCISLQKRAAVLPLSPWIHKCPSRYDHVHINFGARISSYARSSNARRTTIPTLWPPRCDQRDSLQDSRRSQPFECSARPPKSPVLECRARSAIRFESRRNPSHYRALASASLIQSPARKEGAHSIAESTASAGTVSRALHRAASALVARGRFHIHW